MNALWLMAPLFLIRFVLLGMVNNEALPRAAQFAPLQGGEKTAYLFYQLANVLIVLYPLALKIRVAGPLGIIGVLVYGAGVGVMALATIHFARPKQNGLNTNGLYKISRNPMYVGYFVYFLGCVLLTGSGLLLLLLLVFQISAHWIIRSEERWCVEKFGDEYISYMKKVRRYI